MDASLLRDLLVRRSLSADGVNPRGLRLRGARIRGRLDLDYVDAPVALWLDDCLLERGVTARQAHFPALRIRRCRLGHPYEPAFFGDRIRVDGDLNLDRTVATAKSEDGALRLVAARVEQLSLGGATLRNSAGPALAAEALETDTTGRRPGGRGMPGERDQRRLPGRGPIVLATLDQTAGGGHPRRTRSARGAIHRQPAQPRRACASRRADPTRRGQFDVHEDATVLLRIAAPTTDHPTGGRRPRLAEIVQVAAATGDDPALDALILRLHIETADDRSARSRACAQNCAMTSESAPRSSKV